MSDLFYPVLYATTASSALPVAAGFAFYRRARLDTKILLALFILILAIDFYYLYCAWRQSSANWIHHFYLPVEYAALGIVISTWQARLIEKKVILSSVVLFTLLCAWYIIGVQDWTSSSDFTASVACALFVGMASYTLIGIERRQAGALLKDYRFWFLIGLLIYSSGNLAYFAFFRRFVSYYLWAGHNLLNIVANVCYTVGFVCQARWE
ncbi:MAG: hypothetical protein A2W25_14390 [candidate division Zixibacteria bacterium RBG_16_53_22]|nr:MAG: hypothetical protein A2W25_14390 [candidate division Zixibacteria bacterium RBG_16_53_22]